MKFSTYDDDNDGCPTGNCAAKADKALGNGGWWYNQCWNINLNSQYNPSKYGLINLHQKQIPQPQVDRDENTSLEVSFVMTLVTSNSV